MNHQTDSGWHSAYEIGIVLKGLDGVLELAGGIALLLIAEVTLWHVVARLTGVDLAENPHDFVAGLLAHWRDRWSTGSQTFAAIYLVAHGVVKMGLVAGLLSGVRSAYPSAIALMSAFIAYQLYHLAHGFSIALAVFTALDVAIVLLIWREWRRAQPRSAPA